ncbi:NADH-quinone oxidoreductase subunit NuoN [Granulicella sp. 5B5]|uniref:NADH-quinone oxidoreductase subunit N n=1 Tax=Granulicella sp. 5B5 TaxID=1617967 RepID=UPI0015F4EAB0|nr:NADH-quinone oxidoreductase subunit N [Granulicella sp. 5B5]QMV17288.1 NADH-quinone oxidoreductase subunit NuoN [Granulicella sp. 5B5]
MTSVPYLQFLRFALPEVVVVLTSFLMLAIDLVLRQKPLPFRFKIASMLASAGCLGSVLIIVLDRQTADLAHGMFAMNPLTACLQEAVLALAIITLLLSTTSIFTEHVGEYVLLLLLAAVGMMFLISSRDLLVTFVSLELLSLSLYTLTAFDKRKKSGSEAALKYFLFGGMSAAMLLFGFTYLYGVSASTSYTEVSGAIARVGLSPITAVAIITTMIGLGFKVAVAPLHFWAPDVYEGAPSPVAGFVASSSKVASFFILFILLTTCFPSVAGSAAWMQFHAGWAPVAAILAVLSMLVGNFGAVAQKGARRLLAYSAIAHAGYMLIAVVAHTQDSLEALLYYVLTYSLSTLGTFAVIDAVERNYGDDRFTSLDGLSRRAPMLAGCLFIFLLSQAGIPPLAGFFAKFYVFMTAMRAPQGYSALLWLVILAIGTSTISLYYYLKVLKHVYVIAPEEPSSSFQVSWFTTAVVVALAAGVVATGIFPEPLRVWIHSAVVASGF